MHDAVRLVPVAHCLLAFFPLDCQGHAFLSFFTASDAPHHTPQPEPDHRRCHTGDDPELNVIHRKPSHAPTPIAEAATNATSAPTYAKTVM